MRRRYLLILSLCFLFYSCLAGVAGVGSDYYIHFYDESNKLIIAENALKEFDIKLSDNSMTKTYRDVNFYLTKVSRDDKEMYEWHIRVDIGLANQEYQIVNLLNKFNDASEYMGIKIEDKKGRYKPVTIYPLSACNSVQEFKPIVVKLEKK